MISFQSSSDATHRRTRERVRMIPSQAKPTKVTENSATNAGLGTL